MAKGLRSTLALPRKGPTRLGQVPISHHGTSFTRHPASLADRKRARGADTPRCPTGSCHVTPHAGDAESASHRGSPHRWKPRKRLLELNPSRLAKSPRIMASESPFTFESTTSSELEIARTHVRQGNLAEAERVYRQVVDTQPDQVEALRFLANAALSRGEPGTAVGMLSRAAEVNRNDLWVLLELGVAYRSAQRMDEARSVFEHAMELSQGGNTTARLLLANVYELDGRPEMALPQYFRAILDAQAQGQWLNDSTTEPGLRQLVRHAMRYVDVGRHDLFGNALEPFRKGINAARLGRVDATLATYLHERPEAPADPRQKPSFLYIPDPGATCFPDIAAFDWLAGWSARASSLNSEALACIKGMAEEVTDVAPFNLDAMTATHDAGSVPAVEQRIPFYQRGIFRDAMRGLAPQLSGLLEAAPLVRIPNYAP